MKDNSDILHGSNIANLKVAEQPDWKIGYFISKAHPFHNDDFELKWSNKAAGERKPDGVSFNKTAYTLTILIRGKFKMIFPDSSEEYLMSNEGEYVYFPPRINHDWEVVEDTFIITLRWPSIKGDQLPRSKNLKTDSAKH